MTPATTAAKTRRPRYAFGIELPRADQRSWTARRFKHLVCQYADLLGGQGALTEADKATIRQAASSQLAQEELQAAQVSGAPVSLDDMIRASSEARRHMARLEARAAKSKPAGPSVADIFAAPDDADEEEEAAE
jgi:hypothetical protein